MRLTVSSLIKVIATAGLLGVLFMHYDPLEATGRRLFAHPLEEELSYDPSETSLGSYGSYGSVGGQPWSDYGHYQVEQLIAPHDLLKLFKTAAGSPGRLAAHGCERSAFGGRMDLSPAGLEMGLDPQGDFLHLPRH